MEHELERVRDWADAKLSSGNESARVLRQYAKLREALDAILDDLTAPAKAA